MERVDLLTQTHEVISGLLERHGYTVSSPRPINFGIQFTVSHQNWVGLVRLYCNARNALKLDLSQLRSEERRIELQALIGPICGGSSSPHSNSIIGAERQLPAIGTDESGKGDYFGPLVTAGVYADSKSARKLIAAQVMDSKRLSDKRNIELADKIMSICRDRWAIVELPPSRYNTLYEQFEREGKNLNHLLAWQHARALENILAHVPCELAIIDQFANERVVLGKLQKRGRQLKVLHSPRAERHIAVAAASILARARFLERLAALSAKYGVTLPKGSSSKTIACARQLVGLHGHQILWEVAKVHFKITRQLRD